MGAKRKTVHKLFSYRNCDDFAAYLNHMARQGWHFREWQAGLVFEQGEPEDAFYAVEIFTKAEENDIRPLPETEEFAEYCAAAGWEFIDAWRKFVVFKRVREDAVPIMTDEERLQNVVKAENIWGWYPLGHSFLWFIMELTEFSTMFSYRIFSGYHIILMAVWIALLFMSILQAVHFVVWKRQCRKRIEQGLSLFLGKTRMETWYMYIYVLILVLFCLSLVLVGQPIYGLLSLAILAASFLLSFIIGKLRPDSTNAGLIQILGGIALLVGLLFASGFAMENQREKDNIILEPPLTYADMGIDLTVKNISYSREQESIFGQKKHANMSYFGNEYLFYSLYTSEYDWVLDKLWKEETKGKRFETRFDCTDAWGAVEAFYNSNSDYVIRYENSLWVISSSLEEPLTREQIDLAIAAIREG